MTKNFLSADFEGASGVERDSSRTVKVVGEDLLDLYCTFVTIVALTRALVDR